MRLFALNATRVFGAAMADHLDTALDAHEERAFADGEHKARPLVSVRGADAYVVQSLHGDAEQGVNDRLVRLLFFLATLKDNGAARVTAVIPYLAYARKDRQTKPRDPVNTRSLARLIEAAGADAVVTLDVHNLAAYQNAFRGRAWHLDTRRLFAGHLLARLGAGPLAVVSPDAGGVKRAQLFGEMLETLTGRPIAAAFMEKRRSAGVVSGSHLVGEVAGATAIVVDDLIASGHTMTRAGEALRDRGAAAVVAVAAHGLFVGDAAAVAAVLGHPAIDRWLVTDTVPPPWHGSGASGARLETVSAAPLFAEAVARLHGNGSLTDLLEAPG